MNHPKDKWFTLFSSGEAFSRNALRTRTEEKIEYRAGKNRSCCPLSEAAEDGVHDAPHDLGCDQSGRHGPSPEPAKEPPSTGNHQPRRRRSRSVRAGGRPTRSAPADERERAAPNRCRPAREAMAAPKQEVANRFETAKCVCLREHLAPARCLRAES